MNEDEEILHGGLQRFHVDEEDEEDKSPWLKQVELEQKLAEKLERAPDVDLVIHLPGPEGNTSGACQHIRHRERAKERITPYVPSGTKGFAEAW